MTITDKNQGVGYVNIDFASVPSSYINSFDSIYNFDGKTTDSLSTITVYAKNKAGRVLAQYTFIVVDGVNIFDQDGYLNAGNNIVLQKSFGHNDQQSQIDNGKYVKLESYVAKDTIYGNGHLINFDYHNNDADSLQSGGVTGISSWAHVAVSIANAVNLKIQGSNYDESRESYLIELASPQNIAYCEMYNMLRAIELGGNATVNIRKSLFRSFKEAGIVATNEGSRTINLEDVIMFDVGQRAIEVQGVGDKVYVSGFLDVYNYQNKTALKEAIGSVDYVTNISGQIIDAAKSNNMSVNRLNEDWANVICIGVKDAVNRSDIMNSRNQDGSVSVGVPNIEKVYGEYTTGIFNKKTTTYYAWATTNDHPDISWDKEYLENGELNYAVLISTSSKVSRLGGQIEDIE